jgi:hypothetical protein
MITLCASALSDRQAPGDLGVKRLRSELRGIFRASILEARDFLVISQSFERNCNCLQTSRETVDAEKSCIFGLFGIGPQPSLGPGGRRFESARPELQRSAFKPWDE